MMDRILEIKIERNIVSRTFGSFLKWSDGNITPHPNLLTFKNGQISNKTQFYIQRLPKTMLILCYQNLVYILIIRETIVKVLHLTLLARCYLR